MIKRGIFFDLDGTLANSLGVLRDSYYFFLETYSIQGSEKEFQEFNGPPLDKIISILKHRYQLEATEPALLANYLQIVRRAYLKAVPNPGVRELLEMAKARGWVCGVVTSNSEELAAEWLRHHKLEKYFDTIVGKESVIRGKPTPEPYYLALKRTQCDSSVSFAVEDSMSGLKAASASGLTTFAYLSKENGTSLLDGNWSKMNSFAEIQRRLEDA